jgi:hypothetical protein
LGSCKNENRDRMPSDQTTTHQDIYYVTHWHTGRRCGEVGSPEAGGLRSGRCCWPEVGLWTRVVCGWRRARVVCLPCAVVPSNFNSLSLRLCLAVAMVARPRLRISFSTGKQPIASTRAPCSIVAWQCLRDPRVRGRTRAAVDRVGGVG